MSNIENILILIEKYGFSVVVAIIMIYVVVYIVKGQNKKIDLLVNHIINNDDNNKKTTKISDGLHNNSKDMNRVQEIIYQLLKEVDGDRISIFEYHNGGQNLAGIDFKKCTNTYESVDFNVDRKFKDYQNLPISTNMLWTKLLYNNKKIINISDIEKLKNKDSSLYYHLKSQNIKSYYSVLLNNYDTKPIGFLELIYYSKKHELNSDELILFNNTAISIAGLLIKK